MIEEYLVNYGVLGLWTATLLYDRYRFNRKMTEVIGRNTDAVNNLATLLEPYKKK